MKLNKQQLQALAEQVANKIVEENKEKYNNLAKDKNIAKDFEEWLKDNEYDKALDLLDRKVIINFYIKPHLCIGNRDALFKQYMTEMKYYKVINTYNLKQDIFNKLIIESIAFDNKSDNSVDDLINSLAEKYG